MPIDSVLVITLIVAAFTTFGVVLAYAEYQTRDLAIRPADAPAASPADEWRKAA